MSSTRVSLANRLRIGADYLDGHLMKEICERYGLTGQETVTRIARRLGIPSRRARVVLALAPPLGRPPTSPDDDALLAAELADGYDLEFEPEPIDEEPIAPAPPPKPKNRLTGNRVYRGRNAHG